jgi:hypothetical protein
MLVFGNILSLQKLIEGRFDFIAASFAFWFCPDAHGCGVVFPIVYA